MLLPDGSKTSVGFLTQSRKSGRTPELVLSKSMQGFLKSQAGICLLSEVCVVTMRFFQRFKVIIRTQDGHSCPTFFVGDQATLTFLWHNMRYKFISVFILALLLISVSGCDFLRSQPPATPSELSSSERDELLAEVAELEREAENTTPPEASITLPTLPGWSKSEIRPLPPEDHGFTVAYDHDETGLAVTLYQFTRGLTSIPNDVNSSIVKQEMQGAKQGIQQVVDLGVWQAAKEIKSDVVKLGDSPQKALRSQYELTVEGAVVASDIYVWAQANTIFKIRCTAQSEDAESNQVILKPLLTALGSSASKKD